MITAILASFLMWWPEMPLSSAPYALVVVTQHVKADKDSEPIKDVSITEQADFVACWEAKVLMWHYRLDRVRLINATCYPVWAL